MAVFTAIGSAIFGAGTFLAGLTAAALQVTAGIAVSLIGKAMQGEPEPPRFGVQGQLQGGEDVPRSINFGWNCTAGSLVYHNTFGNGGVMSARVIAIGDLPIRSLEQVIVDGVPCTLLKGQEHATYGWPVQQYRKGGQDHLWVKFFDGTQTTAYSHLVNTVSSSGRPYGADRVGYGVPYVVVYARAPERDDNGNKPLFSGIPALKFVTYGVRWYNPAKDTSVGGDGPQRWDNPATWGGDDGDFNPIVQLYNVLRGIRYNGQWLYGAQAIAPARLPATNWITAINQAAGLIAGPDGNEEIFRSGGEIQVGAQVATTVEALLTAANARLSEVGGTYKVYVGPAGAPVMAFTDGDILSTEEQSFTPFFALADTVNGVDASYPNPAEGWNTKKAPPLLRPDLEVLDGNRRLLASVALDLVPYKGQVQRLMKWALAEALRARRHTFVLGPEFRVLEPGDVVSWSSSRNGYEDKLFRVDGIVYKANLDVIVDLTEVDPSDYDWDQETDYVPVVDGPLTLIGPQPMAMEGWQVFPAIIYDEQNRPRRPSIEVRFASGIPVVQRVRVQVRVAGETNPMFDGEVPYGDPWAVILAGQFSPATDYEVRGVFVGPDAALWSNQTVDGAGIIVDGPWLAVTTPDIKLLPGVDFDPYEGVVGFDSLDDDLAGWVEWIGKTPRELIEAIQNVDTHVADQEGSNALSFEEIRREVAVSVGTVEASFQETITVAIVPLQNEVVALADWLTELSAGDGSDINTARFRMTTLSGVAGYSRIGAETRQDSGDDWRGAAWYLDTPNDPNQPTRFTVVADQMVVSASPSSGAFSPFIIDGTAVRMNNAMIANLNAGNIQAKGLTADVIDVDSLLAENVNITGTLKVGSGGMSGPGVYIDGANGRILIVDNT